MQKNCSLNAPGERVGFFRAFALSARHFANIRSIAVMSMLIAICYIIGLLKIPLFGGVLEIKFTFLIYAITGMLFGPVMGMTLGICDQLFVTLTEGGAMPLFFVLYALRGLIYGCLLYYPLVPYSGKRIFGVIRVFSAKAIDTVLYAIIGNTFALWHYGWIHGDSVTALMFARVLKNAVMLPLETFILIMLLSMITPALSKVGVFPRADFTGFTKRGVVYLCIYGIVSVAAVVAYAVFLL